MIFLTIYIKFRWKKNHFGRVSGGRWHIRPPSVTYFIDMRSRYNWNLLVHDEKLLLLDSCHDLDISSLLPSDAEFLSCPSFWFLNNLFKIRLSSTNYCQELNKCWVFFKTYNCNKVFWQININEREFGSQRRAWCQVKDAKICFNCPL